MKKHLLALVAMAAIMVAALAAASSTSARPCWAGQGGNKSCAPAVTTTPTTTTTTPTTTTVSTTTTTTTTAPTPTPSSSYTFDDEFNGAAGSAPDPAKWSVTPWCSSSSEDAEFCYSARNAFVDGSGNLVLRVSAGTMGRAYDGARVQTFTEGAWPPKTVLAAVHSPTRVEVRAKFAPGAGLWESIWTDGVYSSAYEELDLQEFRGAVPTLDACHVHGWGGLVMEGGATVDTGVDLSTGWHVYWMNYYSSHVTFGVDGQTCGDMASADQSQGLRLSNVVGLPGTWGGQEGPPPAADVPADMLVDYVRASNLP